MEKQYKLEVKIGNKKKLSRTTYTNKEEAQEQAAKLNTLAKKAEKNHKYKVVNL